MKFVYLLLLTLVLLTSCGDNSERKQFEFAGGTLTMALDSDPSTFIAREVTDVYSNALLIHIVEGLVNINTEDLSVQPQLAKKWSISPDGLTYTFTLRDDVYFHENPAFKEKEERKLTMEDVVFSFEKACKPNEMGEASSAYISIFADQLKGATEYFQGKSKSISGLKVKGDKLEFTLLAADPTYINKLALVQAGIVSKKVVEANKETDLVGTGPFVFSSYTKGEPAKIILLKNNDYYMQDAKGNALPYLDSVVLVVESRKLEQLDMFENDKTQLINTLPTSRISAMLEGRIQDFNSEPPRMFLYNNPLLITNYYFFNMQDPRFKDVRVRKAFNYAINKDQLTSVVLKNQFYEKGIYGVVPPISSAFKGYDFTNVKTEGYDFNPELAKKLLAEAGFPGGKGFGSVNLRIDIKDLNSAVAEEISEQIFETLGINVNIDGSSFEQKDADADFARGDMFRSAWIADYASPENFLMNFYGKYVPNTVEEISQVNQSRYKNPLFDKYYETARGTNSQKERYKLYALAEKELLKDPPMMVLWYSNDFQLSYSKVRNLKNNALNIMDLRQVYLKEWTKEEYVKSVR